MLQASVYKEQVQYLIEHGDDFTRFNIYRVLEGRNRDAALYHLASSDPEWRALREAAFAEDPDLRKRFKSKARRSHVSRFLFGSDLKHIGAWKLK